MPIEFPVPTFIGQTFFAGGKGWRWNGFAWDSIANTAAIGATGPIGATGLTGQSSTFYNYKADTTITSGTPAINTLYWNNATQISSAVVTLSHIDALGNDLDVFFPLFKTNDTFVIQDQSNSNNFQTWKINAAPTVVLNSYISMPVTLVTSGGTSQFTNNQQLIFAIVTSGLQGSTGATGVGATGATGIATQGSTGATGVGATGATGVGATGATGTIPTNVVTTDTRQTITGEKVIQALYDTTSSTDISNTVPANRSFTVGTGLSWRAGNQIQLLVNGSTLLRLRGTVISYDASTGAMFANITTTSIGGSIAYNDWIVTQWTGSVPALRITSHDTAPAFLVEDSLNPDSTPFTISSTGKVGIGITPDSTACLALDSTGVKFSDGTVQTTAPTAVPTTDVQVFTANGTWTKPNGARAVNVQLLGGGGGGGSGQNAISGKGGNGGSGGGYLNLTIPAILLSATESVAVGIGGTGGTASASGGVNGNAGGNTSFSTLIASAGSGGSAGGSTQTPFGSLNSNAGAIRANNGGVGTGNAGNPITNLSLAFQGGAGGGSGANVWDGNDYNGGAGGVSSVLNLSGGAGGISNGGNGANGIANSSAASGLFAVGSGGGGGASSTTWNGGTGGNGGFPASGGGGGGGTDSGTSGAGGNGANGIAVITTYF
jgi:hypothetical protein